MALLTSALVVMLVATSAMMFVMTGGGGAMLYTDEPLHIIAALNLEPYLPVGDTWPILDLATSALLPGYAFAQSPLPADAFVTTWETTSAHEPITIYASGTYTIDWGDEIIDENVTGPKMHVYADAGNYTVAISGDLESISLSTPATNAAKLQSIEQWGDIEWTTMNGAFENAVNMLYNATDVPNLSGVTDMSGMFANNSLFNGDISDWNVSGVTDMNHMFDYAYSFNRDLNGWNVSSVTNMNSMFHSADSFNGTISKWNVSSVTDMASMFRDASEFNSDISEWDVSGVTSMTRMFDSASEFNSDISNWNVSSVVKMLLMFDGATDFDQNLGPWYVVPDSTGIVRTDVPGVVGTIYAQSTLLDLHYPDYDIGDGDDAAFFEIVNGNKLNMTSVVTGKSAYNVNVTALGSLVLGNGNNWHVLEITVTDSANNAPVAEAGLPRSVDEGGSIMLQGSGSDDDGDDLTYSWSQDSGLLFDNRTSATPTVTASSVTADTPITLTLTVDDGTDSHTDTMVLTILDVTSDNIRPTVDVGSDQTVREGAQVDIEWTATDPDGDSLTYSWSQDPLFPVISLNSPYSSPTMFTAPQVDDDTVFTFTLEVTAGTHTVQDPLTVTVKNNRPPAVDAGQNRTVSEGVPVTLSGTASDPDGDPLTYTWTRVMGPEPTDLTGDNMKSLRFTAPGVSPDEDIIFRFTATDDAESADDTVKVTVRDVPITVSSATYNPGSGTLLIAFNQDIATVDYLGLHVRSSANPDTDGITLSSVTGADYSGRTITATLDSEQQDQYDALQSPHLVVDDGAVTDTDGDRILETLKPIRDASQKKSSSSKAPLVNMIALAQARIVDIPPAISEQVSSHDASDPLEPILHNDTFDFPLAINEYCYLLDDTTNTLAPQTVTAGDDPVTITFTVYTQQDLAHFTLYLNLSDDNTDYANSDTYITYKDDGTTDVTDPYGYIGSATITVTQEDDSMPEKKTVRITIEFDDAMGLSNMVAYMWNTDRKATFIKIIDALEVTAAAAVLPEPEVQAADPEPVQPDDQMPADLEPVPYNILGPDDYDEAQVLHIIRMWSGFESEFITDEQMLASLGLDYPDADIPDWVMTELGVLAAKGDVTVGEFMLALQYVLENL